MKRLKKFLSLFLCLIVLLVACACGYEYKGNDKQFYTQVVLTVPFAYGFIPAGEIQIPSNISVLEKDEYGRTLFYYDEERYSLKRDSYTVFLLINQKFEGETTYYYPDYSYWAFSITLSIEERMEINNGEQSFDAIALDKIEKKYFEEIEALKRVNDWGKPINEQKLEKSNYLNSAPKGKIKISEKVFEELGVKELKKMGYTIHKQDHNLVVSPWDEFISRDKYGRELYAATAEFSDYYDKIKVNYVYTIFYIFTPDKKYIEDVCTVAFANTINIQTELKEFKERNNWNSPL